MTEIKILIVDDHEIVRNGLSVMMEREEDFIVVGEAQLARKPWSWSASCVRM